MANGFTPVGAAIPKRRDEKTAAVPFLGDSIVVPEARDRLLEIFERMQLPQEVEGTLEGTINGDLRLQQMLFQAMLDTWPMLQKCLAELKRAVRKAPWKVTAWSRRGEKPEAQSEALAKEVENAIWGMRPDPIRGIKGFEGTVEELAVGYYLGHQAMEIHWQRGVDGITPQGTKLLPPRYFGYPYDATGADRLMLDPTGGKAGLQAFVDFPVNRFLVAINGGHSGHPTVAAPLRVLTGYWLAAVFGLKWFKNYAQLFGQPIRWATYPAGDLKAKAEVQSMMERFGSATWGVFPANTTIELKESSKSGTSLPQRELIKLADEQCALLILGQTLTSSQGEIGSQALGNVHMDVRQEVIEGVCDFVGEIMTHQFSPAVVALNHADGRTDTPGIWAVFEKAKDEKGMAERDTALGLLDGKLPVAKSWLYERHSVPMPSADEEIFEPVKKDPVVPPAVPVVPGKGDEKPPVPDKEKKPKIEASAAADDWTVFAPITGTIGIPRSQMPQIRSENRAAAVEVLRQKGIESQEDSILPARLKPTQAEFSTAKVRAAMEHEGGDRPLLISEDNHLVDGHHQWLAAWELAPTLPVRVIRFLAPIGTVISHLNAVPTTEREVAASLREDLDDGRTKADAKPTVERLSAAVLEGLTGVTAEWLGPVRPFFERLAALAMAKHVTDEDFQQALEKAQRELPELFDLLDTQALEEAFSNAIGTALLDGSVSRYE